MKKKTLFILLTCLFSLLFLVFFIVDITIYYYQREQEHQVLMYLALGGVIFSLVCEFIVFCVLFPKVVIEKIEKEKKILAQTMKDYLACPPKNPITAFTSAETRHVFIINEKGIKLPNLEQALPWNECQKAVFKVFRSTNQRIFLAVELKIVHEGKTAFLLIYAHPDLLYWVKRYHGEIEELSLLEQPETKEKEEVFHNSKKILLFKILLTLFTLAVGIILWLVLDNLVIGLIFFVLLSLPAWVNPKYSSIFTVSKKGIALKGIGKTIYLDFSDMISIHRSKKEKKLYFSSHYRYLSFVDSDKLEETLKKYTSLPIENLNHQR